MKLIDDKLGGTTPLDVIIKFPANENKKEKTMSFLSGTKIIKIHLQNIGLLEIKLIKFLKSMTT